MFCQLHSCHTRVSPHTKGAHMAHKKAKDADGKSILSVLSHLSLGKISSRSKPGSKGGSTPEILPNRHNTRRKTDEGVEDTLNQEWKNHKSHVISDRSYSCPTQGSERAKDDAESIPSLTPQLSIFQSPFDPQYEGNNDAYRYDVNISYHRNQHLWVEELLLPILENELGLRCYIYERDHLPGVTSVKNIAAAVKESRVTILCFSKDYLSSSWQKYEAHLAHHLDPGGWKKRILPILVEKCALPFKYTIYATLKWPECPDSGIVPATVQLRRRFFISGLLNAMGVHDKTMMVEIYRKYCGLNAPVTAVEAQAEESVG